MQFKHIPKDILESLSQAFFAIDNDWNFTFVNPTAENYWKKKKENLLGKNLWEVFPNSKDTQPFRELVKAVETKTAMELECISPIIKRWIKVKGTPLDSGYAVNFHVIDIKQHVEDELRGMLKKKI